YRVGCIDSTKTKPVVRDNRRVDRPGRVRRPEADPDQQPEQPDESIPPQEPDVEQPNDPDPVEQPDPTPEQPENQPQEPERPTIPDTPNEDTDTSTPDSELQQLISLINQERRKNGLLSLVEDPELSRVARVKAQDIIDNNYFSHYSPTYGSPFDMINEFGIEYQYAGENLAQNTSVAKAHEALMNSSGHRKNILSPNFTHVGIGIKKAERGYIYVEMFIGVPN
ncbi:MAG: CAP domain-containing protein, partial [Bacillota bacterium]